MADKNMRTQIDSIRKQKNWLEENKNGPTKDDLYVKRLTNKYYG